MRRYLLPSTQKVLAELIGSAPLLLRPRGITYATSALLQRGDGRGGRGGWGGGGGQHRQRGYSRGGGGGGGAPYANGPGYGNSSSGARHGNRGGGGGRGPQQGRQEGRGGAPPRRSPEQFLEQNAKTLLEMRRQYKQAKSAKERRGIQREARRVIRSTRVDPSTQDEKSVTILLNSAATFHASPSEGLEQAVMWMRKNLSGLSPQNIALFANAIGVLQIPDGDVILVEEVSPVVQAVMKEMTPVEVVMVLQAFQRERVDNENAELQETLLRQLAPCVPNMPVPQLSTLASVLSRHAIKRRDEHAWRQIVESVTEKAMRDVERMHSKEAITFLTAAAYVGMSQDHMVQLLQRATATVGFHTTEQIGELFRSLASIKRLVPSPSEELQRACAGLEAALVQRLERVAEFATVPHIASLWRHSAACGLVLPTAVQERLVEAAMTELAWTRQRLPQLARFARAACTQKLPSTAVLAAVADYAVGKRVQRRDQDGQLIDSDRVDERSAEDIAAARSHLYVRYFAYMVAIRLHLETAMAANGGVLTESLGRVLPEGLIAHAKEASPRQELLAVQHIALAPVDCKLRNTANDDAIIAAVEEKMRADRATFMERITPAFIEYFVQVVGDAPRAKKTVEMLKGSNKA